MSPEDYDKIKRRQRAANQFAFDYRTAPIRRRMSDLLIIYSRVSPIVVPAGSTLSTAHIKPDQIKSELPPDAQALYEKYEQAIEQLRHLYLDEP